MEGFHEHNPATELKFRIWYDQLQIKLNVKSSNIEITEKEWSEERSGKICTHTRRCEYLECKGFLQ